MSEISEEATNLIDNFEYAVEDAVSDYTMACGASQKHQARRNLEDYIAELEAENAALKAEPKPLAYWSDEKKQTYADNEGRSAKRSEE